MGFEEKTSIRFPLIQGDSPRGTLVPRSKQKKRKRLRKRETSRSLHTRRKGTARKSSMRTIVLPRNHHYPWYSFWKGRRLSCPPAPAGGWRGRLIIGGGGAMPAIRVEKSKGPYRTSKTQLSILKRENTWVGELREEGTHLCAFTEEKKVIRKKKICWRRG